MKMQMWLGGVAVVALVAAGLPALAQQSGGGAMGTGTTGTMEKGATGSMGSMNKGSMGTMEKGSMGTMNKGSMGNMEKPGSSAMGAAQSGKMGADKMGSDKMGASHEKMGSSHEMSHKASGSMKRAHEAKGTGQMAPRQGRVTASEAEADNAKSNELNHQEMMQMQQSGMGGGTMNR